MSNRESWLALLGYLMLGLLLAWPALGDLSQRALGHPGADTWNHVWGYWQVGQSLLQGESPLSTSLIRWPEGGRLWFIDLLGALWTLPVQVVGGPIMAYNVGLIGNWALAGWAAWYLARQETGSVYGAALAGLIFALTPHLLGQAYSGISETLSVGWIPLFLALVLSQRRAPLRRRGLLAGAGLSVTLIANPYYGVFALLVLAALLASDLASAVRRPLLKGWAPPVLLGGAPGLLLLATVFRSSLTAADAIVRRDPDFVRRSLFGHNMVDWLSFFHPGDYHSPDLLALFDEPMIVVVYLGWVSLGLAALGWKRSHRARPWALLALLSWVLALGPQLFWGGEYFTLGGEGLALPFLFFWEQLPLLTPISHAYRFTVLTSLGLAMCAAWGAASWSPQRARPLTPLFMCLVAAESLLLSPARLPLPVARAEVPSIYEALEEGEAVLDLPVSLQVLRRSRYNLYQLHHQRGLPYGLNDPTPELLQAHLLTRWILSIERSSVDTLPARLPMLQLMASRRALRAQGLTAVLVHEEQYPPRIRRRILEFLEVTLGPGERRDQVTLFLL